MVVLGAVLGILGTFVWMFLTAVIGIQASFSGNETGEAVGWVMAVLFMAPLVLAIVLLCVRRTRQAAAGFVMGLAIGAIVLAGFCGSLVVLPSIGA